MESIYARDIRGLFLNYHAPDIEAYMTDYEVDDNGEDSRIWLGIRTRLDGGVDDDFEISNMRTRWIVNEAWRRLEELAEEVEEVVARGDEQEMMAMGIDPETGRGYIALVLKSFCNGEYNEWVVDDNGWKLTSLITC